MTVPFLDLNGQYRSIRTEVLEAVERVFDGAQFVLGEEVRCFEEEFAAHTGTAHAVGVNSGTSAIQLALLAAGVGPGDEVITVPFTFVASVAAVEYTGARPILVDVDENSYTLDPARLEAAITPRTKAILPVHLYGLSADMDPISEMAAGRGIAVIEDAAQAHGARYRGRRCGSMGDAAAFSFYPGKNLGAYGEGGAITTSDDAIARTARMLRDWGQDRKYHHVLRGFNARLEGIQGAVLRIKLRRLDDWTRARQQAAAYYDAGLRSLPGVVTPRSFPDREHVYHIYAICVADRSGLIAFLNERGIQTGIHYPFAVHELPAYGGLGYRRGDFPVSERLAEEVVSLPMFPELTTSQQDRVIAAVEQWARTR
jgi:dTDP-4-amino-4,6-dideoxygalactose transaminase